LETPALNPLDAPAAALERKADILQRLFDSGAINAEDFQRAMQKEIVFAPHPEQPAEPALAFSRLVIDQLSQQFGTRRVEHGGLRVVTTLDYDLQLQTGCALQTQLARLEGETTPAAGTCLSARYLSALPGSSNLPPTGIIASAVLLDVESGEVLAFIGNSTRLGETVQVKGHSPGSVLTPFVALSAFTYDYSPSSLLWDIPSNLPSGLEDKLNPDGKFRGPLRLRMAVANDVLAPLASLVSQLGSQNVWHLARAFGFNSLGEEAIPGELLFGGGDVSLLEVAQAYNTIANQGVQPGISTSDSASLQPVTVLLVEETNGATWLEHLIPKSQVVISSQIAYLTHHILSDDTARRISLGYPNSFDIGRPVGAKAAQAENGAQVWAVGYTPQRLAVVWFGLPQEAGENARLDVKVPAGVWHALIQYSSRDLPVMGWTAPAGISTLLVCDPSGLLPSRDCPTVVSEIFQIGSEPLAADNLYRAFEIDRETNLLATIFTPPELVEQRTFLVVPPEAAEWALAAGLPVPPEAYDVIQPPNPSPQARITSPRMLAYIHGEITIKGSATGENFQYYRLQVGEGLNPRTWVQIGEDSSLPVENGVLGKWDTSSGEGLYILRLQVVGADQRVETDIIQVTVDNTPPWARILSPRPGDTYRYLATSGLSFEVEVEDAIGIRQVEWMVDDKVVAVKESAPYNMVWSTVRGTHAVQVRVTDLAGNVTESPAVSFTVE
jgi:membrane peptidoglycan carboxypeptidase